MESGGISIISVKSLAAEDKVYHNDAFISDDLSRKGSIDGKDIAGNLGNGINNLTNGDKEEPSIKRNSSTVEFTLPDKPEGRDRIQSLATEPYRGMGKEELLRFSSRPLWRNLRYICMSIVLVGWLALLITVVALVLTYPACRKAQDREWWQKTIIYRVYVRSFYDTDNDGIGDIKGIHDQLDYLQKLGVDTISLSPIYKLSPGAPTDTHIINHTSIDNLFGSLQDFRQLVNETHQRGMHITVDFIPNHTSDQHPWFLASRNNSDPRGNEFRSYYVWAQGLRTNANDLPNYWKIVGNCTSAWTKTAAESFYLHQFMESQPDLNLRSDKVREALEDILQFWLDLGVDGFYVRDVDYLFEDYDLRDNVENETSCDSNTDWGNSADRRYTKGLSEIFDMLARWRAFLDEYGNRTSKYRILFADIDGSYDHVKNYYGRFNRDGVDFPLNKHSLNLNITSGGGSIKKMVASWVEEMPKNHWPSWMVGDDRSERLVDRLGEASGPYLFLALLLPGTPYFYYGDEIGLQAASDISVVGSDYIALPMRGPMQWSNKTLAGFCQEYCSSLWTNINPKYRNQMNVEAQMKNPHSLWNLFQNLTALRKDNPTFEYGDYIAAIQDDEVFSFVREYDGHKGYLVSLNFANQTVNKDYRGVHETIPGSAKVEIVTGAEAHHSKGASANLANLELSAFEGIVVSWDYQAKEL